MLRVRPVRAKQGSPWESSCQDCASPRWDTPHRPRQRVASIWAQNVLGCPSLRILLSNTHQTRLESDYNLKKPRANPPSLPTLASFLSLSTRSWCAACRAVRADNAEGGTNPVATDRY